MSNARLKLASLAIIAALTAILGLILLFVLRFAPRGLIPESGARRH